MMARSLQMAGPRIDVHDSLGQRTVALDKPVFTIGRRSTCDLHLMDTDVSREHAEILESGGVYLVRDRGSRYGTFVNGTQVTEHAINHGDRIRLGRAGSAELLFLVGDDPVESSGGSSIILGFRQVASLLESLRALGGARVLDDVLALVIDAAIEVTGAERGFVMLANAAGKLEFKLARGQGKIPLSGTRFDTSRKIPEDVFASGQPKMVADLRDADLAQAHEGTLALGIRHVMCVPLRIVRYVERADIKSDVRAIGVLYLDSREKGTLASHTTRTALETLAAEAAVAIENARLYRETLEKARIEQELRIASQIQHGLLPPPRKTADYFEAFGTSIPCREIGGDFFDYLDLPEGTFGFALGDVAGKGAPAALLTAVLQGIFTGQSSAVQNPAEVMARVNRGLLTRAIEARFATAFFAVLHPDGKLEFCNAGHNPPMLFSGGALKRLEAGGVVLGLFPNALYDQDAVQLKPGDTLVVFSDGVSEALDMEGEEFGDDRLSEAITPKLNASPQEVLDTVLATVRTFAGGAAQNDDMTALVIRYTGPPAR